MKNKTLFGTFLVLLMSLFTLTGCPNPEQPEGTSIQLNFDISQLSLQEQQAITVAKIDIEGDSEAFSDTIDTEFENNVMKYFYEPTLTAGTLQLHVSLLDNNNQVVTAMSLSADIQKDKTVQSNFVFSTSSCTLPKFTITNEAKESVRVQILKVGTSTPMEYFLGPSQVRTDNFDTGKYVVAAVGLTSELGLLSVLQDAACNGSYNFTVKGAEVPSDQFYNVNVHNVQADPVYVTFDSTNASDGALIASGATIFAQYPYSQGGTLRVFTFQNANLILAVKFSGVSGPNQYYEVDGGTPTVWFRNKLNTGATPEPMQVLIDGTLIDFGGNLEIAPGDSKAHTLPYSGTFDVQVQGAVSGNMYVDLKDAMFKGTAPIEINVNP